MRVLLDENLPHDLIDALAGHSVSTVHGLGWAGTKNGALLERASGAIDAFLTMDANGGHQATHEVDMAARARASPVRAAIPRNVRIQPDSSCSESDASAGSALNPTRFGGDLL